MMMILLTAPTCLLSFYLAYLCYRNACYRHSLVLSLFASFMLLITLGLLSAGYLTGLAIKAEAASLGLSTASKLDVQDGTDLSDTGILLSEIAGIIKLKTDHRSYLGPRSLSGLTDRSEKLDVRGQTSGNLRANSKAICRKLP